MLNCKNNDRSHAHVPSFPQWERLAKLWTLTGIVQDVFITTGFLRMPFMSIAVLSFILGNL